MGRLPAPPISAACLRLPGSRCPGGSDVNHAAGRRAGHRRVLSSEQSAGGLASAFRDERASPAGVLERLARTTRRRLELLGGPRQAPAQGPMRSSRRSVAPGRAHARVRTETGLVGESNSRPSASPPQQVNSSNDQELPANRHFLRARCMVEWPRVRFRSGATQTHEPTAPTKRPANAGLFGSG